MASASASAFGEGITGWAAARREPVLANRAHLDPRARSPCRALGPAEPEALITVPLVARGILKGALDISRGGETAHFAEEIDFELAVVRLRDAACGLRSTTRTRAPGSSGRRRPTR